jgi:phosphoribosylformimino-5-aminoimidazole carboxamide ribotide isomerase
MRLIPAIDLRAGRCVRLLQGDFAAETRYPIEPLELLAKYRALGADWLHVVDLDGARNGAGSHDGVNRTLIAQLAAERGIRLQVGGGLRDVSSVRDVLNLGAARAVVGSAALTDSEAVRRWLGDFGAQRIVLALDVQLDMRAVPRVATHGWRERSGLSLWDALARFTDAGLKHVLCTDVSRDGTLCGPNLALYAEAARRYPEIAWQASGGIGDVRDLYALAGCGAAAAISGKALLEELIPIEELGSFLPNG